MADNRTLTEWDSCAKRLVGVALKGRSTNELVAVIACHVYGVFKYCSGVA